MEPLSKKKTINSIVSAFEELSSADQRRVFTRLKGVAGDGQVAVEKFIDELRDKRFRNGFA